ncbi:MAG: 50S ribosomal protein L16 [Candidatus Brocadiae bacterium]|nr:50S ribosomal protein L16 [Candidatus Brocadiia bacterium]
MQLMPSRIKFRKSQRGVMKGNATRGTYVAFGEWGLQALEHCWLGARQIEAGRMAAAHHIGKNARLWIRVFPHKSISKKPLETRMGKGKGEPEFYAAVIRPGQVIYELAGLQDEAARAVFNIIAHKMPIKTRMIRRRHGL